MTDIDIESLARHAAAARGLDWDAIPDEVAPVLAAVSDHLAELAPVAPILADHGALPWLRVVLEAWADALEQVEPTTPDAARWTPHEGSQG